MRLSVERKGKEYEYRSMGDLPDGVIRKIAEKLRPKDKLRLYKTSKDLKRALEIDREDIIKDIKEEERKKKEKKANQRSPWERILDFYRRKIRRDHPDIPYGEVVKRAHNEAAKYYQSRRYTSQGSSHYISRQ